MITFLRPISYKIFYHYQLTTIELIVTFVFMFYPGKRIFDVPKTIASPLHDNILNECSYYLRCIMKANKYLLKANKISEAKQLRELLASGIKVSHVTLHKMLKGTYRTVYINVIWYFAWYWNCELNDLFVLGRKIMRGEEIDDSNLPKHN